MAYRLRKAASRGEPALLFFNISASSTRYREVSTPSEQVPILKSARSFAWLPSRARVAENWRKRAQVYQ